ncbi:hypothetical protein EDD15DRAFT_2199061 [Pisolithus albus]|nr:hypothetical protein EDD15DRAFT_2199061 [Pisolithus albus]
MSQYAANTGLPPASAILDWTAVPDEAIQSASDDDQQVADAKFAERQRRKRLRREQKAAAEAAERERREREEAERREREESERREREEAERREREEAERREREETERREREEAARRERESAERMQARSEGLVGVGGSEVSAGGTRGKGKATEPDRAETPVGPCNRCLWAQAQCTFELAKASKRGKRSCDRCTGLKEQCKLPGVAKEGKAGKRVPEDQTSPRAGEKKKRARARSPEVEVVGGPSKMPEAESGGGGLVGALHAIAEAIDRHTEEMQEHRRLAKSQHETQRRFNNHLWELLQETEYRQAETDESEGDDTSEGEPESSKSSDDGWEDDVREEGTDAEAEV